MCVRACVCRCVQQVYNQSPRSEKFSIDKPESFIGGNLPMTEDEGHVSVEQILVAMVHVHNC